MIPVHQVRKPISDNSPMAILKHIRASISVLLLIMILTITVTTSIQPVFAPRDCPDCAEFRILFGEFVQNVINRQPSPNSDNVGQFRILTAQFERDVINAVINDQPSIIKVLAGKYSEESMPLSLGEPRLLDDYLQVVLRIFCESCI